MGLVVVLMLLAYMLPGALSQQPATASGSPTISGIPPCWSKIMQCFTDLSSNATKNAATLSSSTNTSDYISAIIGPCCPTIKEQITNEKQCFCSMNSMIQELRAQNPSMASYYNFDIYFSGCKIPGSMDSLCSGVPEKKPMAGSDTGATPTGGSGTGAASSYGPSSGLILLLLGLMFY